MRYMLDTNICIHLIQRHPPEVMDRFARLSQGDVVMSVVTPRPRIMAGLRPSGKVLPASLPLRATR